MTFTLMEAGALAGALEAATETGLFHALAERPMSAAELAESLGLARVATERVLEVLRTNGLVEREGERHAVPARVRAELAGPETAHASAGRLWSHTTDFLRRGETWQPMRDTRDRAAAYAKATPELARMFAGVAATFGRELAARFGDRTKLRILDVGAGSGVWSLAALSALPGATAVALDLDEVLPRFLERADALGLSHRVDVLAGDYHQASTGRDRFDLVLLANVVHLEAAPAAQALVARWIEVLADDGAVVIVDMLDGSGDADRVHAAYALHLALRVPGAFPHHERDLRAWLAEAGLARVERISFVDPFPTLGALVARR